MTFFCSKAFSSVIIPWKEKQLENIMLNLKSQIQKATYYIFHLNEISGTGTSIDRKWLPGIGTEGVGEGLLMCRGYFLEAMKMSWN